jgi:hypothetical protein
VLAEHPPAGVELDHVAQVRSSLTCIVQELHDSLPFRGYDGTRLTALGAFTAVSQRRASFEIRSSRRS